MEPDEDEAGAVEETAKFRGLLEALGIASHPLLMTLQRTGPDI
jgi:hypothetical protein